MIVNKGRSSERPDLSERGSKEEKDRAAAQAEVDNARRELSLVSAGGVDTSDDAALQ